MALSKEIWAKAKLMFEHGDSLTVIAKETGINKGTISRKSNEEKWIKNNTEKTTLVEKEIAYTIMHDETEEEKATLDKEELRKHNSEVRKKLKSHDKTTRIAENYQDIIEFSIESQTLLLNKLKEMRDDAIKLARNPKELIGILHGFNKQYNEVIDMAQIKTAVEANDKASVTLGLNDRHAPRALQAVQLNTADTNHQSKTIDSDMEDDEAIQIYLDMVKGLK